MSERERTPVMLPGWVRPYLDEEAAHRRTSRSGVVLELIQERFGVAAPAPARPLVAVATGDIVVLPLDCPRATAHVYEALGRLVESGPVHSSELSEAAGICEGNVNKHLRWLRDRGYVRKIGPGLHVLAPHVTEEVHAAS